MRDFYHLSQPCHDKFLSVFKYNIIFALENQRRAPVLYESRLTPLFYQKTLKRARMTSTLHSKIRG